MLYNAIVVYKAFPTGKTSKIGRLPEPMEVQLDGETVQDALEDAFKKFNHAFPGKTGQMAEKFGVRSMCIGDEVTIGKDTWVCAFVGWVNLSENPDIIEDDPMIQMHRTWRDGAGTCGATA